MTAMIGSIPLQFAGISAGQRTMVLAVIVLLGVFVVLDRIDAFRWDLYLLFTLVVTVLATNAVGFNVLGFIIASPVFPIIAVGFLYLGWKALQAYRASNETVVEVAADRMRRE